VILSIQRTDGWASWAWSREGVVEISISTALPRQRLKNVVSVTKEVGEAQEVAWEKWWFNTVQPRSQAAATERGHVPQGQERGKNRKQISHKLTFRYPSASCTLSENCP
jgi:hypothetical protein